MSKELMLAAANMPVGSVDAYIHAANQVPMLTEDEEHNLGLSLRDDNDLQAAQRMVLSHLRFVVKVARGYLGYGLALPDLIQEGNVGLMKAVKRFNPDVGVRLVSFAVHWIRAEIHEFILRNWRIVKVATTKAQRKLFFNLRSSKKRLGWFNQEEINSVAETLGVKPEAVVEMEKRLSAYDLGFDASSDDDDDAFSPSAYLASDTISPAQETEAEDWQAHSHNELSNALNDLDSRSRHIISARWLGDNKSTLQELADEYGVSAERIRQIEANALKKMRKVIDLAA